MTIRFCDARNRSRPRSFLLITAFVAGTACSAIAQGNPPPTVIHGTPGVVNGPVTASWSQLVQYQLQHPQLPFLHVAPHPLPRPDWVRNGTGFSTPNQDLGIRSSICDTIGAELVASFMGHEDDQMFIPPDTDGAVGPNNVVSMLNEGVLIQDKAGNRVAPEVSLDAFWSSVAATGSATSDPHVYFDPYGNHWIASCLTFAGKPTQELIAVTKTADPTGTWRFYSVTVDSNGNTFGDYPILGFNSTWAIMSTDVFNFSTGAFLNARIFVFDKAKLYSGGPAAVTIFNDNTGGFAMASSVEYDPIQSTEYLLEDWNGNNAGQGYLRLSTVTGPVGMEALTVGVAYPSSSTTWSEFPVGLPQEGTSTTLDPDSSFLYEVVLRNGSLWTAHNVFLPSSGPNRCSVQWWQIDTSGNVQQVGLIDDPTGNVSRAYPSIAADSLNDALVGYSEFSTAIHPSAYYSFRSAVDPPDTLQPEQLLKDGETTYDKDSRWGDYSVTTVDPADDTTFWTIQEYASSPPGPYGGTWGVYWGHLNIGPPPAPGDFDRDGWADLLLTNPSTGQLAVWFMQGFNNTGATLFSPAQDPQWRPVGVGDFDGDGTPDIMFQNNTTGQLAIWYTTGETATNGDVIAQPAIPGWKAVAVADFTGSGLPDVLFQNQMTNQLSIWLIRPPFTTSAGRMPASVSRILYVNVGPMADWRVVGVSQFNADKSADIVFQNEMTGQLAVWYMNQYDVAGGALIPSPQDPSWQCVAVADFAHTCNGDLIFQNVNTGQLAYWQMAGTSVAQAGFITPTPPAGWIVTAPR